MIRRLWALGPIVLAALAVVRPTWPLVVRVTLVEIAGAWLALGLTVKAVPWRRVRVPWGWVVSGLAVAAAAGCWWLWGR